MNVDVDSQSADVVPNDDMLDRVSVESSLDDNLDNMDRSFARSFCDDLLQVSKIVIFYLMVTFLLLLRYAIVSNVYAACRVVQIVEINFSITNVCVITMRFSDSLEKSSLFKRIVISSTPIRQRIALLCRSLNLKRLRKNRGDFQPRLTLTTLQMQFVNYWFVKYINKYDSIAIHHIGHERSMDCTRNVLLRK